MVIGSGSVKSAAAIGLFQVLKREGIGVDMIVGCSGGSIYASLIALEYAPEKIADMSSRLWTRDVTHQHRSRAMWQIILPNLFGFDENFGMVDDAVAIQRLTAAYGDKKVQDTPIRLLITATDFNTGELVVLTEGKIVDAVRASIAIPYVFGPHRVGDRVLVDGYLSDPLPIGVAMKEGANVIVAMGFESPYQGQVNSLMRYTFQISSIMSNNLLKANYAFHSLAHHTEVIPIIPQFKERIGLFDTEKIPSIVQEGIRATEEQLPYLKKLLNQL